MTTTEADEIKALLIMMRRYFISHNCPTGECVAWRQLKEMFDVGQSDAADEAWMTARTGRPFRLRRSADETAADPASLPPAAWDDDDTPHGEAPPWLTALQDEEQPRPRPPLLGVPSE